MARYSCVCSMHVQKAHLGWLAGPLAILLHGVSWPMSLYKACSSWLTATLTWWTLKGRMGGCMRLFCSCLRTAVPLCMLDGSTICTKRGHYFYTVILPIYVLSYYLHAYWDLPLFFDDSLLCKYLHQRRAHVYYSIVMCTRSAWAAEGGVGASNYYKSALNITV